MSFLSFSSFFFLTTESNKSWNHAHGRREFVLAIGGCLTATTALSWWIRRRHRQRQAKNDRKNYRRLPHVHSWIPYIGSALAMKQASSIRQWIQNTAAQLRAPAFTATVMGDTCVFIADAAFLPFVFRDVPALDNLTLQKRFLRNILQFTAAQNEALLDAHSPTPKAIMKLFHEHLLKEESLEKTLVTTQQVLRQEVNQLSSCTTTDTQEWITCNMFEFVSTVIFKGSVGPLLSMHLNQHVDEILPQLRTFESYMGLMFIGTPRWIIPAGNRVRDALVQWFDSPKVRATESTFLQQRRATLAQGFGQDPVLANIMDMVVARNNMGIFLATAGNSIQAVFWTLVHLVQDKAAWEACRAQVLNVLSARRNRPMEGDNDDDDDDTYMFTLQELNAMTLLYSAFQECLRMYQALFLTRQAVQDIVLEKKKNHQHGTNTNELRPYKIEKGSMIYAFPNTMHMDPTIFENPETFQYDRFANPQTKSVQGTTLLSSHLKPFGGGAHMCPGRKFIGYEARAFLAMMLLKYDVRLAAGQSLPSVDLTREGTSVYLPAREVQMEICIRGKQ